MVKDVQGTIYQCSLYDDSEGYWSICNPKNLFASVSKKEVEKHEEIHQAMINQWKENKRLRGISEEVLKREIRVGKLDDWRNILSLSEEINFLAHRQGRFKGQTISTHSAEIGLVAAIKKLIWLQTEEGISYEKRLRRDKEILKVIEAILEKRTNRKKDPKDTVDNIPEIWKVVQNLRRELLESEKKFDHVEGLNEAIRETQKLLGFIQMDVTISTRRGIKIALE